MKLCISISFCPVLYSAVTFFLRENTWTRAWDKFYCIAFFHICVSSSAPSFWIEFEYLRLLYRLFCGVRFSFLRLVLLFWEFDTYTSLCAARMADTKNTSLRNAFLYCPQYGTPSHLTRETIWGIDASEPCHRRQFWPTPIRSTSGECTPCIRFSDIFGLQRGLSQRLVNEESECFKRSI